ncbi:hypothetical protein FRC11_008688 [Ceratobasidium sp. 423]|nr:hypothetical protein FRC11_008688 [Ceratobasidium sp. 423]
MERFCGRLLPAVKNPTRPYKHLDHYIERHVQLQIVANTNDIPSLAKSRVKYKYDTGKVPVSAYETVYEAFNDVALGRPVNTRAILDDDLQMQMAQYFGLVYPGCTLNQLRSDIAADSLVRYGRFHITEGGDTLRTAISIEHDPVAQDNSYVKYDLLPDRNAAFRRRPDDPMRQVQYGQLLDIYYVEYITPAIVDRSRDGRLNALLALLEEARLPLREMPVTLSDPPVTLSEAMIRLLQGS